MDVTLPRYRSSMSRSWSAVRPAERRAEKREEWGTLPNALARSSQAMQSSPPRLRASSRSSWNRKLCSRQPSAGVNPFWAPDKSPLAEAHPVRRLARRLQNSFPQVFDRAIGRQLVMSPTGPFLWISTVVETFQAGGKRLAAKQTLNTAARTCPEGSRRRHTPYLIPSGPGAVSEVRRRRERTSPGDVGSRSGGGENKGDKPLFYQKDNDGARVIASHEPAGRTEPHAPSPRHLTTSCQPTTVFGSSKVGKGG
ncbi:hypothetical protein J6590_105643 [Homalodisca vitripennis]|nr:hypothetical protein J6590_105643 [Homalodisca vitripennis]